jgi:hypothetical protein
MIKEIRNASRLARTDREALGGFSELEVQALEPAASWDAKGG